MCVCAFNVVQIIVVYDKERNTLDIFEPHKFAIN